MKPLLFLILSVALFSQQIDRAPPIQNLPGLFLDRPGVPFPTIFAACSAAAKAGKTLAVTERWLLVGGGTLACDVQFLGNGKIQPANGQTVTFTVQSAGLTTICDISAGGRCLIHSPGGIQYPEWRGARADGSTASGAAILATLAQIPCGVVQFSPGIYLTNAYLIKDMTSGDDCDIEGALGNGRLPGTAIRWTGARHGRMMGLQGANQDFIAKVGGIHFDGNNLASVGLWIDRTRAPELDRLFFENFIPDPLNSTACLDTGIGIYGGSMSHLFFFSGTQRAIGINQAGLDSGPIGWKVENNYFQQVLNEVLNAHNTSELQFTNNVIDGLIRNTGQKGLRIDSSTGFRAENNYWEGVYGTIYNINPTTPSLQVSGVGQTAKLLNDSIVNSGHAGSPTFAIANSEGVDIRNETTYQRPAGAPAFAVIAPTADKTVFGHNNIYGVDTFESGLVTDNGTRTIYDYPFGSSINIAAKATRTILAMPAESAYDLYVHQDAEGYWCRWFITRIGSAAPTGVKMAETNASLAVSFSGNNVQVFNGAGSARTVQFKLIAYNPAQ